MFIGKKEIKEITKNEDINIIGVLLDDNNSLTLTVNQFEVMKSEEPYRDEDVQLKKYSYIVNKIIDLMMDEKTTLAEQDYILEKTSKQIGGAYRQAIAKMFNVKNPEDISIGGIHTILTGQVK
jgi:hypothetical protein